MKTTKFANTQTSYEYETERRQEKKASQALRKQKQGRKNIWQAGE
jgi:hypothetical protein